MGKITFSISKKSSLDELEKVLASSSRCYRHLKISQQIFPIMQIIQPHLISLSSISLFKIDFESFDDFTNFMLQIEATIDEIHLEQVKIIFSYYKLLPLLFLGVHKNFST